MNASNCRTPIAFSALIDYWLDELDEAASGPIEEHLLGCGECSARLAGLVALGGGIRAAFQQGEVRTFVAEGFVKRLAERGVRVREDRVPCNGSINCSVAPEDDVIIARLEAPLEGVSRLDAIFDLA